MGRTRWDRRKRKMRGVTQVVDEEQEEKEAEEDVGKEKVG